MATPPRSPPPPTSPPPADSPSAITKRNTGQTTRLRKLTARSLDQPRPSVNVNPITSLIFLKWKVLVYCDLLFFM